MEPIRTQEERRNHKNVALENAQETILAVLAAGQLPVGTAISEEDFDDQLLREVYLGLCAGRTLAAMADSQVGDEERSRIARLMKRDAGEDTTQRLRMVKDCLNTIRKDRLARKKQELLEKVKHLEGQKKQEALEEFRALMQQEKQLDQ